MSQFQRSWSACDGRWHLIGLGTIAVPIIGKADVPLETAGVAESSRHWPDRDLQDQRAATQLLDREEASSGYLHLLEGAAVHDQPATADLDSDWTRGQRGATGRADVPLDTVWSKLAAAVRCEAEVHSRKVRARLWLWHSDGDCSTLKNTQITTAPTTAETALTKRSPTEQRHTSQTTARFTAPH